MQRQMRLFAVCGALIALAYPASVSAALQTSVATVIGTFKLPGGLEVIASENHESHLAVIDTFLAVGSSSDYEGYAGIAAATAFAVWNGGKLSPADAITKLGGRSEVAVDRTITRFHAEVPADQVDVAIAAIGEAFSHPDWPGLDLARTAIAFNQAAHGIVESPINDAYQAYLEASNDKSFGHPIYGRGPFDATRPDIETFFERYYVPSRVKIVLVGDFSTGKEVGQVVRGYAAVLQRAPSTGNLPTRRTQAATGLHAKLSNPWVLVGSLGPDIANQREQAAFEILVRVIAGSPNGRLDRVLGSIGGAKLVLSRWERHAGPGQWAIGIETDASSVAAVQTALTAILAEIRANPVTLDEHAKAMAAVVRDVETEIQSDAGRAKDLGIATIGAGDPYWVRTYPEEIRQVSRQDVLAVAQKYLTPNDVKTLILTP
jgi:zinc protease